LKKKIVCKTFLLQFLKKKEMFEKYFSPISKAVGVARSYPDCFALSEIASLLFAKHHLKLTPYRRTPYRRTRLCNMPTLLCVFV
jgi:hypothetical protein